MKTQEVLPKYAGFNHIVNGNFPFWQRKVGYIGFTSSSQYIADRFIQHSISTGVLDISRSTDVPNSQSRYSYRMDVTTADATPTYVLLEHRLEGSQVKYLYGKSIAISFWVKSNLTGIYTLAMRNGNSYSRSFIREYSIDVADTWERKVLIFPHEIVGTWGVDDTSCMSLTWSQVATLGINLNSPDTWHNGNYYSTSNQVNIMASTSNYFMISQCMMHEGRYAIDDFIPAGGGNLELELQLCQRYYEKSYNHDVDPGTITSTGAVMIDISGLNSSTRDVSIPVQYKVKKVNNPNVHLYSINTGTIDKAVMIAGDITANPSNVGQYGFRTAATETATTPNARQFFHFTADAEL